MYFRNTDKITHARTDRYALNSANFPGAVRKSAETQQIETVFRLCNFLLEK